MPPTLPGETLVPPSFQDPAAPARRTQFPEAQTFRRTFPRCRGRSELPAALPSRPRRALTAGEQHQGHGDDHDNDGDPQDPQQPLQEGLKGEVPSDAGGAGPARAAAHPPLTHRHRGAGRAGRSSADRAKRAEAPQSRRCPRGSPRERLLGGGWGRLPWERQARRVVQDPGFLLALRFERRFLRQFTPLERGDTAVRGTGGTWDTGGISVGSQITAQK